MHDPHAHAQKIIKIASGLDPALAESYIEEYAKKRESEGGDAAAASAFAGVIACGLNFASLFAVELPGLFEVGLYTRVRLRMAVHLVRDSSARTPLACGGVRRRRVACGHDPDERSRPANRRDVRRLLGRAERLAGLPSDSWEARGEALRQCSQAGRGGAPRRDARRRLVGSAGEHA